MNRNFYIDHIYDTDNLNKLSIVLNEMEEVSRIKIGKNSISFVCADPTDIQDKMLEVDDSLILKEEINEKKRVYKAPIEKKETIFMFTNLDSLEDAKEIEEVLSKYSMYENVSIDFQNKLLKLTTADKNALKRLNRIVDKVNPKVDVEQWRRPFRSQDMFQEKFVKKYIRIAGILVAAALGLVTRNDPGPLTMVAWFIALAVVLENVLLRAYKDLRLKQFLTENVLIVVAVVAGWIYGAYLEAILVALIYQIGESLLVRMIGYTMDKIDNTINVPQMGRRETDGKVEMIPLDDFDIGDTLVVLPGETILLGGQVIEGDSQLDTYAITGKEVLDLICEGEEVSSGSINMKETLKIKVLYSYDRSAMNKVLEIATLAPTYDSRTDKIVALVSKYFTRLLVVVAVFCAIVLPFVDPISNMKYLYLSAVLLTLSGTYAYKQASSFSVLAGVTKAFSKGIIIKENSGLDALNLCCSIIYDRFDGVEVTEEEMELFDKLKKLHKNLVIFNDGPVALENDQYTIHNDLSVDEKLAIMEQVAVAGPVAYIGDTYKDVVLLQKAFVGISRGGLHDKKVTENSDVLITNSNYDTIVDVFKLSRKQKRVTIENTLVGIICNVILVLMALSFTLPWTIAIIGYLLVVFFVLFNTHRILH